MWRVKELINCWLKPTGPDRAEINSTKSFDTTSWAASPRSEIRPHPFSSGSHQCPSRLDWPGFLLLFSAASRVAPNTVLRRDSQLFPSRDAAVHSDLGNYCG